MSVKIRMKRFGRTNRAFFRINAVDSRAARDGRVIEELGSYDPHAPDDRKVKLNAERVQYWLSVGAQPSDTVRTFLEKAGLVGNKKVTLSLAPVTAESVAKSAPSAAAVAVPAEVKPATEAAPDEAAPAAPETPADPAAPAPAEPPAGEGTPGASDTTGPVPKAE